MTFIRTLAAIILFVHMSAAAEAQATIQIPCNCQAAVDVVLVAQGATAAGNIIDMDGPCSPLTATANPDGSVTVTGCDNGEGCQFVGSVTFTSSSGTTAKVDGVNLNCDTTESFPGLDPGNVILGIVIESCSECQR
jgi:hypothetical protein